ncbi:MAG: AAA family ATPase [SAR202 cluster bacterium]|nr:AAA family ATPase [SAR202 cluster bacterium]
MQELGDILKRVAAIKSPGRTGTGLSGTDSAGPGGGGNDCPRCGGLGWYTFDVPVGSPEFGKVIHCDCQKERVEEERFARLLRYSNLGTLSRYTFESLDPNGKTDDPEGKRQFTDAAAKAREYADGPKGWLVLVGPHGSGKTHLAAAIANRRIQRGNVALFIHVSDLMDHLRASFAPNSEIAYTELFEQVRNTPFMVLDGLGGQTTSPWALEKLQQIVNHRSNAELPTVLTTTKEPQELDPYIASRLTGESCAVVRLPGQTRRTAHGLGRVPPQMVQRMTLESFDVRGNNPTAQQRASLEHALGAARNYAADPDGWLTLFGGTGVGKTHLAVAIAGEQLKRGKRVFLAFVPELLDYLRYTYSPQSTITYDRLFDEVKNAELLVLDDLGQEHTSPWAYEKLYQIVVYRHNARLPTVVTTMVDFTEEAGPIGSRVQDPSVGQLVRMDAPDYRNKNRGAQRARGTARRT